MALGAAEPTRAALRLLLAGKDDLLRLLAVEAGLEAYCATQPGLPAPSLLSGLYVRIKYAGNYILALVEGSLRQGGAQLLALQLPLDAGPVSTRDLPPPHRITIKPAAVSGTDPLSTVNWEQLGRAELAQLAGWLQQRGQALPLAEAAAAAWRKQAALQWHAVHGAKPAAEQQLHLGALLLELQDPASAAEMQRWFTAAPELQLYVVAAPGPAVRQQQPPPNVQQQQVLLQQQQPQQPQPQPQPQPQLQPQPQQQPQQPQMPPALAAQPAMPAGPVPAQPELQLAAGGGGGGQAIPPAGPAEQFQGPGLLAVAPGASPAGPAELCGAANRIVLTGSGSLQVIVGARPEAPPQLPSGPLPRVAPALQRHIGGYRDGQQEWLLTGSRVLVMGGLPAEARTVLPELERLVGSVGATVACLTLQNMAHAAAVIERLQGVRFEPTGLLLAVRPVLKDVQQLEAAHPEEVAAAERKRAELARAGAAPLPSPQAPRHGGRREPARSEQPRDRSPGGRSRSCERDGGRSRDRSRCTRSRSRSWDRRRGWDRSRGGDLPGRLPTGPDPALAPVLVRHLHSFSGIKKGTSEALLTTDKVFVGGLPSGVDFVRAADDLAHMAERVGVKTNFVRAQHGDHRGDVAYIDLPNAACAAALIERLQGAQFAGRNLFLRPLQGKVQSALARMRPADAAAVQARLARLAAEAGAELPFGPEPPHGGTPAQRAPPLAPVLVRHKDGQVEWRLTGSHVFMSGLLPSASLQDLCSMIEGAGGTVNQSRMERGDRRGDIAYIRLASATQAAMIIERLQRTSFGGASLYLRPEGNEVRDLERAFPEEAAEAKRLLAARASGAHPGPAHAPANGFGATQHRRSRSRSPGRRRHGGRSRSPGRPHSRTKDAGPEQHAKLAPVLAPNPSGAGFVWQPTGGQIFVRGFKAKKGYSAAAAELRRRADATGATVLSCSCPPYSASSSKQYDTAVLELATASQAATVIHKLQKTKMYGWTLTLGPDGQCSTSLGLYNPEEAAAVEQECAARQAAAAGAAAAGGPVPEGEGMQRSPSRSCSPSPCASPGSCPGTPERSPSPE